MLLSSFLVHVGNSLESLAKLDLERMKRETVTFVLLTASS